MAQQVSSYSLAELSRRTLPLMNDGGSILTMTYYGAEKVIPNYNVMGVAKAALESSVKYVKDRSSDKMKYSIEPGDSEISASVNVPLFEWVIENWNYRTYMRGRNHAL